MSTMEDRSTGDSILKSIGDCEGMTGSIRIVVMKDDEEMYTSRECAVDKPELGGLLSEFCDSFRCLFVSDDVEWRDQDTFLAPQHHYVAYSILYMAGRPAASTYVTDTKVLAMGIDVDREEAERKRDTRKKQLAYYGAYSNNKLKMPDIGGTEFPHEHD